MYLHGCVRLLVRVHLGLKPIVLPDYSYQSLFQAYVQFCRYGQPCQLYVNFLTWEITGKSAELSSSKYWAFLSRITHWKVMTPFEWLMYSCVLGKISTIRIVYVESPTRVSLGETYNCNTSGQTEGHFLIGKFFNALPAFSFPQETFRIGHKALLTFRHFLLLWRFAADNGVSTLHEISLAVHLSI